MKSIGQMYAIRDKKTNFYIPEPTGREGRGGSHTEPVDPTTMRIRLFPTPHSAKCFLNQWLRGKHIVHRSQDWETGHWEEDAPIVIPVKTRIKEDMEIVPINLVPTY